ncbi:MAG: hypothetical protein DRJ67_12410 [Thermoprotei archaeon]|nr:MAG: hypothetical protein DRJ67_12410 [Thermoprotei archaeon]
MRREHLLLYIRRLKLRGLSDLEIAARLGVGRKAVVWLRRSAATRYGIHIPRLPRYGNPTREVVLGIVQALAERDGGTALMRDVYRLYERGTELGLWEPRTRRRIAQVVRELEREGLLKVEEVRSFGRYGRCGVVRVLGGEEAAFKLLVEELLL